MGFIRDILANLNEQKKLLSVVISFYSLFGYPNNKNEKINEEDLFKIVNSLSNATIKNDNFAFKAAIYTAKAKIFMLMNEPKEHIKLFLDEAKHNFNLNKKYTIITKFIKIHFDILHTEFEMFYDENIPQYYETKIKQLYQSVLSFVKEDKRKNLNLLSAVQLLHLKFLFKQNDDLSNEQFKKVLFSLCLNQIKLGNEDPIKLFCIPNYLFPNSLNLNNPFFEELKKYIFICNIATNGNIQEADLGYIPQLANNINIFGNSILEFKSCLDDGFKRQQIIKVNTTLDSDSE